MMRLIFIMFLGLIGLSCSLEAKERGQTAQLSLDLQKAGGHYTVTAKNISGKNLSLPKMYLASPEKTGYWLFLYNPRTKEIEYAWSSGIGSPRMLASELERFPLKPNAVVQESYDEAYIHRLFQNFSERGCYYLLVKYRKRYGTEVIESPTSAPVRVCH